MMETTPMMSLTPRADDANINHYSWDNLPTLPDYRTTVAALGTLLDAARLLLKANSTWQHKTRGAIYKVKDVFVDSTPQKRTGIVVAYEVIEDPEDNTVMMHPRVAFTMPLDDWASKMQRVAKIERWEVQE